MAVGESTGCPPALTCCQTLRWRLVIEQKSCSTVGSARGGDVLRAIALGAKAVLIGRPHAWALAAGGEAGVSRVLEILRDELATVMVASGCATVAEIDGTIFTGERSDNV